MRTMKVVLATVAIVLPLTIALAPSQSASALLGANDTVTVTNPVTVKNTASTPLFVATNDANKQLQSFQVSCSAANSDACYNSYPVPANKRFVIESISVLVGITAVSGRVPARVRVTTSSGNSWLALTHTGPISGTPWDYWAVTQQVKLYADSPGGGVGIEVVLSGPASGVTGQAEVSGYLVDM